MSIFRLITRSLLYHRRMHAGLLVGTALACAILTGALLVGDSVDYSLRAIAAARLGRVDWAMEWANRTFAARLADNVRQAQPRLSASAILRLRGSLTLPPERAGDRSQLNRVQILGVAPDFWAFAQAPPKVALGPQQAAVNEKTARALGVQVGDDLLLRVARQGRMPLDAPLVSRNDDPVAASLVTLAAVLSDAQLGKFSLSANQITPYNVFVDRSWLQEQTGNVGRANLLIAGGLDDAAAARNAIDRAWTLDDVGLRLREHVSGVVQLESDQIFIDEEAVEASREIEATGPTLTYLVNAISCAGRMTPYSFVEAGPVPRDVRDDQVVISQWLADQLNAAPGDSLEIAYYRLLPNNAFAEEKRAFTVHSVAPMETLAVERDLAPEFPGLSDVESCSDWDVGMPMDQALLKDAPNEAYWREYGQTPKLMVTLKAGQEMWGNRFGNVTTVRFAGGGNADATSSAEIGRRLREGMSGEKLGLRFVPVRQMATAAVNQAMDFGGLFLGMSFFLIASALILLGLLYVFGLQQRSPEFALLTALGFSRGRIRAMFLMEALSTAFLGALLGAAGGAAYARLLLAGLRRFWPAAVAGTAIDFHVSARMLAGGAATGVLCAILIVTAALWRAGRYSPHTLMTADPASSKGRRSFALLLPTAALAAAAAISLHVWQTRPDTYTLPFFAVGALVLVAQLGYYRCFLLRLARRQSFRAPRLWKLAMVNLTRRHGRSLSVAGLTACGCFLVFTVSSMQENVGLHARERSSGTGGFAVFAESTVPLAGTPSDIAKMMKADTVALRVRDGDDAGCLNLNRAQAPRLFGVDTHPLLARAAFARSGEAAALWSLLDNDQPDGAVPALVGDTDTAMWGLKKKTGDVLAYRDEAGEEFRLRIVGALPMRLSLFQGSLLISEKAFTRLFPAEAGFRAFLIDADAPDETARRINTDFQRYGIEAVPALQRLRDFYAVEATYLAMFFVLGGLGLVLGAGGLGIVVLRNVFERRPELALLHALGYERQLLFRMLLSENAFMVAGGVGIGAVAAAVAIVPIAISSQTVLAPTLLGVFLGVVSAANGAAIVLALWLALPRVPSENLREE